MKIGIDVRVLMDEHYSGISEYTANLLMALFRRDSQNEYRLFYNSFHNLDKRLAEFAGERRTLIGRHYPNKIFNYFGQKLCHYPKLDRVLGHPDIFWSPHFNFTSLRPRPIGPRRIVTVHDLSFLRYPEFFSGRKNFWHRALPITRLLREADRIIAVSRNTKNDIVELIGVPEEKITVIYSGNNITKRPVDPRENREFWQRQGLAAPNQSEFTPFILYLGNIEPRKNIRGLIAAFNILRSQSDRPYRLILAGAGGWKNQKIYADWAASPYHNDIKFLGYISRPEKEILYSTAAAFAYPSFYEGFGFPPLEAMAYGVPVVASNVSSLPEVVGDAALTVNPDKASELARALQAVLSDAALRERLIKNGYARAALFSWDKAAAEYLSIFQELYGEGKN